VNSSPKLAVLAMGLLAFVPACEDDGTIPPPPDKPEQIETSLSYVRSGTGLGSNDVTSFLTLLNGEFWVGTRAGVSRYSSVSDTESDENVTEITGLPHPQVTDMVEHGGKVYVATWGGGLGVYDVAGDSWTQLRPVSGDNPPAGSLTDGFIADLSVSPSEDLVYCASNDAVFKFAPSTGTFTREETADQDLLDRDAGLAQPPLTESERALLPLQRLISAVTVREQAGVIERWYGPRIEIRMSSTQDERVGILVSKTGTEYKYTRPNSGLSEPNVNDIFFDATDGTYWVAYVNKGVSHVDVTTKTWTNYDLANGLPSNTVTSITRAKDNKNGNSVIWAATQNGLAKLVGSSWKSYGVSGGLPSERVQALYSDDGQRLWVGFVDAGAVRIK
jgi:hypothetical protein